ncbi:MAG: 1-acyl-sn-glycerol-3-phosphate acyltransferase [Xanthobacteraceae bacterium]|nr:MAG: 1-acyl-sn-glycerol-3-phosphate acyltransferase [Xanthobacteraceae bacterium]
MMVGGVRCARAALHLGVAAWKLSFHAPFWSEARHRREVARWSRKVFTILGVRLAVSGEPMTARALPLMVVANHVSWLDIHALLAVADMRFVAKSEVLGWPVIGRLAARLGTVFVERGRRAASRDTNAAIAALLRTGKPVCVFPEGTTTDGHRLEPFRAALLEPATALGAVVQPVAIRYRDAAGEPSDAAAFIGDMTVPQSLWRLARRRGLRAEVHFLAPVAAAGLDRRALAARAERTIAGHLGVPVREQPCVPPRDIAEVAIAFDIAAR